MLSIFSLRNAGPTSKKKISISLSSLMKIDRENSENKRKNMLSGIAFSPFSCYYEESYPPL
jgi:hypothetical protein